MKYFEKFICETIKRTNKSEKLEELFQALQVVISSEDDYNEDAFYYVEGKLKSLIRNELRILYPDPRPHRCGVVMKKRLLRKWKE